MVSGNAESRDVGQPSQKVPRLFKLDLFCPLREVATHDNRIHVQARRDLQDRLANFRDEGGAAMEIGKVQNSNEWSWSMHSRFISWRGLRPQPIVEVGTYSVVIHAGTRVAEKLMAEK